MGKGAYYGDKEFDIVKKAKGKDDKLTSGTALVKALVGNEQEVTIDYSKTQMNSGGKPTNDLNSKNGIVSDMNIIFSEVNVQTQVSNPNGIKSENLPGFIVLREELIHALVVMDGHDLEYGNIKENTYTDASEHIVLKNRNYENWKLMELEITGHLEMRKDQVIQQKIRSDQNKICHKE